MTATLASRTRQRRTPAPGPTFTRLVRSEWIKFWSIRSTVVSLGLAATVVVGLGAVLAAVGVGAAEGAGSRAAAVQAVEVTLLGAQVATLLVAVIGVVVITGEYSTGAIRTSLAVVPRRHPVLWAKAATLVLVIPLVLGPAVLGTFFLGQAVMAPADGGLGIGDPAVLRLVLGNVFVMTGTALAGLGLGALIRNTAGALCGLLGLVFVLPTALLAFPQFPGRSLLIQYNFANSTSALTSTSGEAVGAPPVVAGVVAFLAWTAVFLVCGAVALRRRDA